MTALLTSRSFFLSNWSKPSSKTYESRIVNFLLNFANQLLTFISSMLKKSTLVHVFPKLPWKSIIIFLFIISLSIVPSSTIQLSALPNPSKIDLSQRQFGIPFFSLSNILLLSLILMFVRQYYLRTKFKIRQFEIFLLFFLIISEFSIVAGINLNASLVWLLKLIYGLTIYLVFSRLFLNTKQLMLIWYTFLATIFLEGIIIMGQFLKGGFIGLPIEGIERAMQYGSFYSLQGTSHFRVTGTFSHPNLLTLYLALLLPITIAFRFSKNNYLKIMAFIAITICIASTIFTLSRWGFLTILFAFIFNFILLVKLTKFPFKDILKTLKLDICVFLVLGIALLSTQIGTERFFRLSFEDKNLFIRLELISQARYMIQQNPLLGVGGGNFLTYFINFDFTDSLVSQRFLAPVHNFYLLLMTEIGIPSFFFLMLAIAYLAMFFLKTLKNLPIERQFITIGLFTSFVTFFFSGLWGLRSFEDRAGFLCFLLLGVLVNILSQRKTYVYQ